MHKKTMAGIKLTNKNYHVVTDNQRETIALQDTWEMRICTQESYF